MMLRCQRFIDSSDDGGEGQKWGLSLVCRYGKMCAFWNNDVTSVCGMGQIQRPFFADSD